MLLVVPYMAMAFGAKKFTGVILPMLCMADIMAVCYYKRMADWKTVAGLLPTAVSDYDAGVILLTLILMILHLAKRFSGFRLMKKQNPFDLLKFTVSEYQLLTKSCCKYAVNMT